MYSIYYTNFAYGTGPEFETVEAALAYGKSKGFEFSVHSDHGQIVASWTVFGGTTFHDPTLLINIL